MDRLEMMRDALNQFEDLKQKALVKEKIREEKRRLSLLRKEETMETNSEERERD